MCTIYRSSGPIFTKFLKVKFENKAFIKGALEGFKYMPWLSLIVFSNPKFSIILN